MTAPFRGPRPGAAFAAGAGVDQPSEEDLMTLADHTNRAQLRVLESVPAPVIPLREPTVDEEMCREAAHRLRAAAKELPELSQRLWDAATHIERAHTARAVAGARKLLGRDLGPVA